MLTVQVSWIQTQGALVGTGVGVRDTPCIDVVAVGVTAIIGVGVGGGALTCGVLNAKTPPINMLTATIPPST